MRLKQRAGDFRVRELLADGYLAERGRFRVFRVTKRKLTSLEAAAELARAAGVDSGEVALAGLKDRQGVTIQYMSVHGGVPVDVREPELRIEQVGFADDELTSEHSHGNAFEIMVRALERKDMLDLRVSLPLVREHGVPNYFDDQRFGNLRHGQGWVARELMLGRHEEALRSLVASASQHDDERARRFKGMLRERWGEWGACIAAARGLGRYHSVFEHLEQEPQDFAGAFTYVGSRERLIHLYAYQSHVWNRALAAKVRQATPVEERVLIDSVEGPLVCFAAAPPSVLIEHPALRLPGPGLEDVGADRELFERVLAAEDVLPEQFRIEGVPGFALKGEDRAVLVVPRHLRVRPPRADEANPGAHKVLVRFELPRGSYATLVVRRLFAHAAQTTGVAPVSARGRFAPEGGWLAPQAPPADDAPRFGAERRERGPREQRGASSGAPRGDWQRGRDDRGPGGGRPGGGRPGGGGGWRERGPRDERGAPSGAPRGDWQRGRDDRGPGGGRPGGGRPGGGGGWRERGSRDDRGGSRERGQDRERPARGPGEERG